MQSSRTSNSLRIVIYSQHSNRTEACLWRKHVNRPGSMQNSHQGVKKTWTIRSRLLMLQTKHIARWYDCRNCTFYFDEKTRFVLTLQCCKSRFAIRRCFMVFLLAINRALVNKTTRELLANAYIHTYILTLSSYH